jgi:hypothetical protein
MNTWAAGLPGVSYTPGLFSNCSKAWSALACGHVLDPDNLPECTAAGSRAVGEACNVNEQCASLFCKQTGLACGQCAAPPPVGSACALDGDCAPGTWCMPSKTCQRPRALNETCTTTLRCRNDLTCYKGKCVTMPRFVSAACDPGNGLICDWLHDMGCTSANKCATFAAHTVGQSCGGTTSSFCTRLEACANGLCQAAPADKAACDDTAQKYCEGPASCIDHVCHLPSDATCASGAQ